MESIQGKHFSITDKQNVSTVIYQVNETNKNEVLDLLVELEEYIISIDKDNLDQIHEDYRELFLCIRRIDRDVRAVDLPVSEFFFAS